MASKTYEFDVQLTCEGCSNQVTKVLNRKEGISDIKIDLPLKKVYVTSTLNHEQLLAQIQKTGKNVTYVGTVDF